MARFNINDIVRIKDINDPAYRSHNFYLILEINEERGYKIRSLQTQKELYLDELLTFNMDNDYFDNTYRLVTLQEQVLYGKQKI